MELSVIVPSIRPGNLTRLYNSLWLAFKGSFEMIVIGPYPLPPGLENTKNIKFIQDFGSPVRCMQIGLKECKGDYISWAADDGFYIANSLDIAFDSVKDKDYKHIIVGKYYEGGEALTVTKMKDDHVMNSDKYYHVNFHSGSKSQYIDNNCLMIMVGIISRKFIIEAGGWDASLFEACPMAFIDLSVRLYKLGGILEFQEAIMFRCGHMPGHQGDHGPIHDAQVDHDEPLFRSIYNEPQSKNRIAIDIENWKQSSARWGRRFGI